MKQNAAQQKAEMDEKKKQFSVMMLWKLGLGHMGKFFNGEDPMPSKDKVPTEDLIKNGKPMPSNPDDFSVITVPIVVPKEAMKILRKGHIPEAQEDHWFMYCTNDMLRYYRSWSGECAYECHYMKLNKNLFLIDKIKVNRSLCQFGVNGDFSALLLLHYLLAAETGGNWRDAWDAFCNLRDIFPETKEDSDDEEEEELLKKRPTGLDLKDKIRGCLIGGAVGDALGYEIEFKKWHEIEKKYGKYGIRRYDDHGARRYYGVARVSDDTQMSIFTAGGLLNGLTECILEGKNPADAYKYVKEAYVEWLGTQIGISKRGQKECWFANADFLNEQRAPGETCLTALSCIKDGREVKKYSKGCGGVMRTAPLALYFAGLHDRRKDQCDVMGEAAMAGHLAWLTHRHPNGWLPSCALHMMIALLLEGSDMDDAVRSSISFMEDFIAQGGRANVVGSKIKGSDDIIGEGRKLVNLLKLAYKLGSENTPKNEAYKQLGEGWVGEEALAIAVYCSIRYSNPKNIRTKYKNIGSNTSVTEQRQHMFEEAICCSVNHSGDSDSTGSICGQLLGAWLGLHSIPGYYTGNMFVKDPLFDGREENCDLEGRLVLMSLADDLYEGCPFSNRPHPLEIEEKKQKQWYLRYILKKKCDSSGVEQLWNKHFKR